MMSLSCICVYIRIYYEELANATMEAETPPGLQAASGGPGELMCGSIPVRMPEEEDGRCEALSEGWGSRTTLSANAGKDQYSSSKSGRVSTCSAFLFCRVFNSQMERGPATLGGRPAFFSLPLQTVIASRNIHRHPPRICLTKYLGPPWASQVET